MTRSDRPAHIAIVEANNFHEETLFALATAARQAAPAADLTVFAPDHWQSRSFLLDDMRIAARWRPFDELAGAAGGAQPDIDLLLVTTFPSPAGQPVIESSWARARAVLGLVHDLDFFADPSGAAAALRRHPNLTIAYPGPAAPEAAAHLAAEQRAGRVARLMPVLRPRPLATAAQDYDARDGIALPGALEFARRDYPLAWAHIARTKQTLRVFGRSHDSGDGPKKARDLDADRAGMLAAIESWGIADRVEVATDVTCRQFYDTVARSRWVAVLPNQEDYLRGKLTGAVVAAVSCEVPMLVSAACARYYTGADPDIFGPCMLPFGIDAEAGDGQPGSTYQDDAASQNDAAYRQLCRHTLQAREALIEQNVGLITRLLYR